MFRFTIRDVLWLTVVVGLAVGWGAGHWRMTEEASRARKRIFDAEFDATVARIEAKHEAERARALEASVQSFMQGVVRSGTPEEGIYRPR